MDWVYGPESSCGDECIPRNKNIKTKAVYVDNRMLPNKEVSSNKCSPALLELCDLAKDLNRVRGFSLLFIVRISGDDNGIWPFI